MDAGIRLWRDPLDNAFATVPQAGHVERYALRSRAFRNLARLLYGDRNPVVGRRGGAPRPGSVSGQALKEALESFEALALRGEVRDPRPRLCRGPDGAVWLDLGGPDWAAVRIAAEGWRVVPRADVPLIRPAGLLPLPLPVRVPVERALADLGRLLNLRRGPDGGPGTAFKLVVAWLVDALHPEGPYPVLAIDGEQGSGKTVKSKMLRRLVDPNHVDARAAPREERDLLVAARNGRLLLLDNLSGLDPAMADAICRVASGGGSGERVFFTQGEEYVVQACNPVLLNGIPSLLARGDLADRALAVTLPAIPDARRRPEAELWAKFEAARPGILALLLDGLSRALRDAPRLRLPRLPRMADFARIACAAAPAFGWTAEEMLAALEENRAEAVAAAIESDPIAVAVRAVAEERGGRGRSGWSGTASTLLAEINARTPPERQRERDWPKDATRLSGRLRRIAPALRRAGVELTLPEAGGRAGRIVGIRVARAPGGGRSGPGVRRDRTP